MVANLFEHLAQLAIAALDQRDFEPRVVASANFLDGRGLREHAITPAASHLVQAAAIDHDAATKLLDALVSRHAGNLDEIRLSHAGSSFGKPVCKLSVIGKEEQSFAEVVQPPDGVEAREIAMFADALLLGLVADEVDHGGPAFRIGCGRDTAARLVHHEVAMGLRAVEQLAIDTHVIFAWHGACAQLRDDLAVHLDAAFENDLLGGAARGDAGLRENFLQPLAARLVVLSVGLHIFHYRANAKLILTSMALDLSKSQQLQQKAEGLLPGGVDSPVRAFRAVGGHPPFVVSAEGAYLMDADGNRYLDMFGSWGPMLLGHAFPPAVRAIQEAAARSASFGASTPAEAELASLVQRCFPSMERMRFVSSGTEACMSAIRLARGFTERPFVIKFEGCYHGHADALLVKAGSGAATFGIPGSAGVPSETAMHTLALPYNDLAAVEAVFASHPELIACVILEPVVGNAGTIAPVPGFFEGLRALTRRHGALLIFDEVMTGFRLALGGAQELYGFTGDIAPDLTTLGKIVGGGLPVGVFGGRAEIMEKLAPLGPVYQAGTLSGNPLAMAAGIATLEHLIADAKTIYPQLEQTGAAIFDGVAKIAAEYGIAMTTNRVGSMGTWFFTSRAVTNFASASTSDTTLFGRFHRAMLERGIWLPPSQYEAAFVSTAIDENEVRDLLTASESALRSLLR